LAYGSTEKTKPNTVKENNTKTQWRILKQTEKYINSKPKPRSKQTRNVGQCPT